MLIKSKDKGDKKMLKKKKIMLVLLCVVLLVGNCLSVYAGTTTKKLSNGKYQTTYTTSFQKEEVELIRKNASLLKATTIPVNITLKNGEVVELKFSFYKTSSKVQITPVAKTGNGWSMTCNGKQIKPNSYAKFEASDGIKLTCVFTYYKE